MEDKNMEENPIYKLKEGVRVRLGYYRLPFLSWDGKYLSSVYVYNDKLVLKAPPFQKRLYYHEIDQVTIKKGFEKGKLKSMGFGYSFYYEIQIHHHTSKVRWIFVGFKEQEDYKNFISLLKKKKVKSWEEKQ